MNPWARPIEELLGQPLTQPYRWSRAVLQRLVDDQAHAGVQLVFRASRYGADAAGNAELARDVCALANRLGGIVVVGVAHDRGVAIELRPVRRPGTADVGHVQSIVASWCAPPPDVEVVVVVDSVFDSGFEQGYLVLVVPPSGRRPHAVAPPGQPGLSWPRRQGAATVWLTEPELAEAYRARTLRAADDSVRLDRLVAQALPQLDGRALWLVTGLVPANRGAAAPVDRELAARYGHWARTGRRRGMRGTDLVRPAPAQTAPQRVRFGRREDGPVRGDADVAGTYLELHTDGVGLAAQRIWQPTPTAVHQRHQVPSATRLVTEEAIAELTAGSLQLLCRHAVEHGGTWGEATAVTVLTDGGQEGLTAPVLACGPRTVFGLEPLPGSHPVHDHVPRATAELDVVAVATRATDALQAARLLGSGLLHSFGWPELSQFTPEGGIRIAHYGTAIRPAVARWAAAEGVAVSEDPLTS